MYYYGARYYDQAIGRFISEDPVKDGWNWYAYCRNNPLKYVDPTGLITYINEKGVVTDVVRIPDTSIYQVSEEGVDFIGRSYFMDTFSEGDKIHVGVDKTDEVMKLAREAHLTSLSYEGSGPNLMGMALVAKRSLTGNRYDLKNQWRGEITSGIKFMGKYGTQRDAGNFLAGLNARNMGVPYDKFQKMAGAVHQGKGEIGVAEAFFGEEYGPFPTYGEIWLQYRMSKLGYYQGGEYYDTYYDF